VTVAAHLRGARWRARQQFVPPPGQRERELLDEELVKLSRLADLKAALAQEGTEDDEVNALLGRAPVDSNGFDRDAAEQEARRLTTELTVLNRAIEKLAAEREAEGERRRLAKLAEIKGEYLSARRVYEKLQRRMNYEFDRIEKLRNDHFDISDAVHGPQLEYVGPTPPAPRRMT
jgi:hypothetical protein